MMYSSRVSVKIATCTVLIRHMYNLHIPPKQAISFS